MSLYLFGSYISQYRLDNTEIEVQEFPSVRI